MAEHERRVKALVIGDIHYTRRRPRRRKDNFAESVAKKMREIVQIAEAAQFVIMTGDMFHSTRPSWHEFVDVATWLSEIRAPKIVCAGNHDMLGGNFESVNRTPLGVIRSLGLARVPSGLVEEVGLTIMVMPFSPTRKADDYLFDGQVDIVLTHDLLYPDERPLPFEYRHTAGMPRMRAKAVVVGHVHLQASGRIKYSGVDPQTIVSSMVKPWTTEFVWPGPVIRGSTGHEFAQIPGVVWLDIGEQECQSSFVRLSSAIPFEEAFDVKAYEDEKRSNAEFDNFLAGLRKAEMRQDSEDVFAMVRQSEAYLALSDKVREYAEKYLQEVERGGS